MTHLLSDDHGAANNHHRRRRRTAAQQHQQQHRHKQHRRRQQVVDGSGNPLDCAAILVDGPPVLDQEEPPPPQEQEPTTATALDGADNADGRDTNGSFDESVMLYQLCLEQEEAAEAPQGGGAAERDDGSNANADAAGPASAGVYEKEAAATNNAATSGADDATAGGAPRLKFLCPPYDQVQDPAFRPRGKFLSYSYDVHVRTTTHVLEAAAEYEAEMAGYLARRLGLDRCADGGGGGGGVESGGGRRHRWLQAEAQAEAQARPGETTRSVRAARAPLRRRSLQDGRVEDGDEKDVPVVVGISAEPRDMPNFEAGEFGFGFALGLL